MMRRMSLWSATLTLFLVLDPIGNIPVWVTLLKDVPELRRRAIILRECVIALVVLVIFLFFGPALMRLLAVEGPALQVAGGVVIFLIALRMIFPRPGGVFGDEEMRGEPFVVPLAIPLLAGPSAMATVMLLATQSGPMQHLGALAIAWLLSLLILLAAPFLARTLGQRAMIAGERLFGMLLAVIAVHMIMVGIDIFIRAHAG